MLLSLTHSFLLCASVLRTKPDIFIKTQGFVLDFYNNKLKGEKPELETRDGRVWALAR